MKWHVKCAGVLAVNDDILLTTTMMTLLPLTRNLIFATQR